MSDSAETMRINKFVTANGDGKIWSAGIDIKKDSEWHYNAIECHSSERELAIARRDAVFAALSASGTKSDGGELPRRPFAFAVPRIEEDRLSETDFRLFLNEEDAQKAAEEIGADYEGLYRVGDRRWVSNQNLSSPPEWLWWGEVDGKNVVTFGRWPKQGACWRYKLAEIQPTEHDHKKDDRQTFDRIISSLKYDGADENSLTVGEIRRAMGSPSDPIPSQPDEREAIVMIDVRISDLHDANEIFARDPRDMKRDIQRNQREIMWLRDLRSIIILAMQAERRGAEPRGCPTPGACSCPPAPIAGLEPMAWRSPTDVPSIELGSSRELILAVYRKHSDKVYSFAAEYLNGYPLRYEYGCPKEKDGVCDGCGDGCPTTGWYYVEGADDDGYTYHALSLDDGDEIKGWRELPQWGEDQFTRAQLEAYAAEQVRACASIADSLANAWGDMGTAEYNADKQQAAQQVADAIRARGQV